MKVKVQDYDNVTVIELHGDLDSDTAELLQNTISDLIVKSNTGIVVDMKDVEFIDSKGLEKLLWARDYCSQNRREFRLAALDENCRKILEITRLESELDHYDDVGEAVKSFA